MEQLKPGFTDYLVSRENRLPMDGLTIRARGWGTFNIGSVKLSQVLQTLKQNNILPIRVLRLLQIHARHQPDSHDYGVLNRDRRESFLISSVVPQTVDSREHSFRRTQSWLRHITKSMKSISWRTQRGERFLSLRFAQYQPAILPTESAEWDVSRWDHTK